MSEENKEKIEPELTEAEQNDRAVFEESAAEFEAQQNEPENDQQAPEISTREMLAPVIHSAFQILAPNWNVKEKESGQLATVWGAVLDKYFPDGVMNNFGLEIAAISTTAMIVLPRIRTPRKEKPKAEEKAPNQAEQKATGESITVEQIQEGAGKVATVLPVNTTDYSEGVNSEIQRLDN